MIGSSVTRSIITRSREFRAWNEHRRRESVLLRRGYSHHAIPPISSIVRGKTVSRSAKFENFTLVTKGRRGRDLLWTQGDIDERRLWQALVSFSADCICRLASRDHATFEEESLFRFFKTISCYCLARISRSLMKTICFTRNSFESLREILAPLWNLREYIQDIYFSHHSFPNHSQEFVFSRSILKTFDLQQTPSRNSLFKGVPIDGLEAEIFRGKLWVRLNTDIYLGNEISFPRFVGRTELKFIRRTSRLKASRYQQLCFPQRRRNELIVRAF